jgi:RNA polymerase sigma factor (sigma-70 family)
MSPVEPSCNGHDPLLALLGPVLARDPLAIEAFVRATAPSILRVVRQILGAGHPDVVDVVQEALIAALQAVGTFRGQCTLLHFVWRVAALTALNTRRRLQLREQITPATDTADESAADALSPLDNALAARRRDAFRRLLDELPAVQSEALALHCVLGFTITETADATGAAINTVRSRLLAAKAALRQRLTEDRELWELMRGAS